MDISTDWFKCYIFKAIHSKGLLTISENWSKFPHCLSICTYKLMWIKCFYVLWLILECCCYLYTVKHKLCTWHSNGTVYFNRKRPFDFQITQKFELSVFHLALQPTFLLGCGFNKLLDLLLDSRLRLQTNVTYIETPSFHQHSKTAHPVLVPHSKYSQILQYFPLICSAQLAYAVQLRCVLQIHRFCIWIKIIIKANNFINLTPIKL